MDRHRYGPIPNARSLARLPKMELPRNDGDPMKWLMFVKSFFVQVDHVCVDDSERQDFLRRRTIKWPLARAVENATRMVTKVVTTRVSSKRLSVWSQFSREASRQHRSNPTGGERSSAFFCRAFVSLCGIARRRHLSTAEACSSPNRSGRDKRQQPSSQHLRATGSRK